VWDSRVLNHCIMFFAGKIHRLRDWLQPGFMFHSFPKGVGENHKLSARCCFLMFFTKVSSLVLSCSMDVLCFLLKPSISPQHGGFTNHPPANSYALRGVRGVTFTASLQLGQDWCSKLMHSDGWIQPQIQVGFVGKQMKLEDIPKSSGLSYHIIPLLYMCCSINEDMIGCAPTSLTIFLICRQVQRRFSRFPHAVSWRRTTGMVGWWLGETINKMAMCIHMKLT